MDEIKELEDKLSKLYRERKGKIIDGIAYCCCCGENTVSVDMGYDTCFECMENI